MCDKYMSYNIRICCINNKKCSPFYQTSLSSDKREAINFSIILLCGLFFGKSGNFLNRKICIFRESLLAISIFNTTFCSLNLDIINFSHAILSVNVQRDQMSVDAFFHSLLTFALKIQYFLRIIYRCVPQSNTRLHEHSLLQNDNWE